MPFTRSIGPWRTALSTIGAIATTLSVLAMLARVVWTAGMINAGVGDLTRRMGIAETQMAALTGQVSGLREAMIHLQDVQPSRHASEPYPNLYTDSRPAGSPSYHDGGMN